MEYEIEKAVLNITSVHDKSRAYVRIVFRRKFENHITNTFLQACSSTPEPPFSKRVCQAPFVY